MEIGHNFNALYGSRMGRRMPRYRPLRPHTAMTDSGAQFELDLAITPETAPLRLDLAVESAAGTRRSIGGHLHPLYEF